MLSSIKIPRDGRNQLIGLDIFDQCLAWDVTIDQCKTAYVSTTMCASAGDHHANIHI
jgi:hypothetical protein